MASSDNGNTIFCSSFNLTIISAEKLPNVHSYRRTRAHAKVLIGSSDKKIKGRTPSDKENGLNPAWNHPMAYEIAGTNGVPYDGLSVVIKLFSGRCSLGGRYIGEVHTSMTHLYDIADKDRETTLSLPVTQGTVETAGILNLSYSFGEKCPVKNSDFMEKVMRFGGMMTMQVAMETISFAIFEI